MIKTCNFEHYSFPKKKSVCDLTNKDCYKPLCPIWQTMILVSRVSEVEG